MVVTVGRRRITLAAGACAAATGSATVVLTTLAVDPATTSRALVALAVLAGLATLAVCVGLLLVTSASLAHQLRAIEGRARHTDRRLATLRGAMAETEAASIRREERILEHLDELAKTARAEAEEARSAAHDDLVARILGPGPDHERLGLRWHLVHDLEAVENLRAVLDGRQPLPPRDGWSISPDALDAILHRVLEHRPRGILEVGSGFSTVLLAGCVRLLGAGHVVSLEHEPAYADRTRRLLEQHGLSSHATVLTRELRDQVIDGVEVPWYAVTEEDLPASIDLLFVDGPPGTVAPEARWPALPRVAQRLTGGALVILDDADRPGEDRTVTRWSEHPVVDSVERLDHQRGTAILRVRG